MFHIRKIRSLLAPTALSVAAALSPNTASADAVAQAYLDLSNFGFTATSGSYSVVGFSDSGDVSASIYGGAPATDTFNGQGAFTLNQSVGPDAGSYVPLTAIVGAPTQNYVGSYSYLNGGDPATYGVSASVDNVVSLTPGGTGTAQSNTNLTATFLISVTTGTAFNLAFDANAFYRTMLSPLGASGAANAAYNWDITVRNSAGAIVFQWSPDGLAGGIIGGTEVSDAFDMTQASGINFGGLDFQQLNSGHFEANSIAFSSGLYSLTIDHKSNADATLRVPEPDVLALMALGLFGVGFVTRRRRQG